MTVKFSTEKVDGYTVLRLYGDMLGSVGNCGSVSSVVSDLIRRGDKDIVFDVSSLASPSSDLVGIIVQTYKRVNSDKGSVGVVYDGHSKNDIFETCGVYTFARHYVSLEVFKSAVRNR